MPFGGHYQATPGIGMAAKLPGEEGDTTTCTLMTYGYNAQLSKWSPFHGALYAVVEAVSKIVAMGGDYKTVRLSLQEYFEKLGTDRCKWWQTFCRFAGCLPTPRCSWHTCPLAAMTHVRHILWSSMCRPHW
jgi:phosphoribosylformylglycinamidine synthase